MAVYFDRALATTGNSVYKHISDGNVMTIPTTYKEAMESPQATKWKEITNKEMDSLQKHAVYDVESHDATTGRPKMMKPEKSLYGLRQSPCNWFNTIDDSLRDMRFTVTASDPCVYIADSDDNLSNLTMYVDDLLLATCTVSIDVSEFLAVVASYLL